MWKLPLENVTLSPAAMTSFEGMNWLSAPKRWSLRIAAGGGPCSPRNTVYVVAVVAALVERAGIAAPGTASAAHRDARDQ